MRTAELKRDTKETQIDVKINLDGRGKAKINTPSGFFNHMLELLAKHSQIDIEINAQGDTEVDLHHTVEDTGIVLGEALNKALGDRKGIERYASIMMVMDKVRCDVAVDLGGRSNLVYQVEQLSSGFEEGREDWKGFDYSLIEEFMQALADNLKATIHIEHMEYKNNENKHHVAEAAFKGLARALRQAVKVTGEDIPSTKGII